MSPYPFLRDLRPTTLAAIISDTKRYDDINILAWRILVIAVGQNEAEQMVKEAARR